MLEKISPNDEQRLCEAMIYYYNERAEYYRAKRELLEKHLPS